MNQNDNVDSDENIDDIEQKMSFLDTFLSDDEKKEQTQIEEHIISSEESSRKPKKIHSIKEYMKRKENHSKNISPFVEFNLRKMQYVAYAISFLVFLIICYCFNLFSLLMVMIPVLLLFYLLNENRAMLMKMKEKNNEKVKMKDLELAQCLLNI